MCRNVNSMPIGMDNIVNANMVTYKRMESARNVENRNQNVLIILDLMVLIVCVCLDTTQYIQVGAISAQKAPIGTATNVKAGSISAHKGTSGMKYKKGVSIRKAAWSMNIGMDSSVGAFKELILLRESVNTVSTEQYLMEFNVQRYRSIIARILIPFGMGWNVYVWKDTMILEKNA